MYKRLSEVLGVNQAEAEKIWAEVSLDGDERYSAGVRLRLPHDTNIGQNGDIEYDRAVAKMKEAIDGNGQSSSSRNFGTDSKLDDAVSSSEESKAGRSKK